MAILNDSDILRYCPNLAGLIGTEELAGKLDYVQNLVESSLACNREIELKVWTEKFVHVYLTPEDNFYLSYTPVDLTFTPTIKIRKGVNPIHSQYAILSNSCYTDYCRNIVNDWETLSPDDYSLYQNGELLIHKTGLVRDLQVEYRAGLNFLLNNQEIRNFKSAVGNLLNFITSDGAYQGIEEVQVPFDEYRIKYSKNESFAIPEQLLVPFRKYRPRSRVI